MLKIFDEEVIKYLKSTGVSAKEIKRIQYTELKNNVVDRLKTITDLVKNDADIDMFLGYSPAGDCMGCDNNFINFGDLIGDDYKDINEITTLLKDLKV